MAASASVHLLGYQVDAASLRNKSCQLAVNSAKTSIGLRFKTQSWTPSSLSVSKPGSRCRPIVSSLVGEKGEKKVTEEKESVDNSEEAEQVQELPLKEPERDFAGSPYIPVYVMLPLGVINEQCQLVDPEGLRQHLRTLKSANVDGIMVDCWWGIVEGLSPQKYNWSGYRELFNIVRETKLKLQVVMSLHECGGNVGDDVNISLPKWILEIGKDNPDIFFTDQEGRRNTECLTWGIDKERVLRGRTGLEVCFDYMRSFRMEFNDYFEDGLISEIEIGLGPCGELRYPSYPERHGWKYPGIGEFQCYDKYLQKNLRKAAEARGHSFWARGPYNAGHYNAKPQDTGFFRDGGDYDSYYGRFFLSWYSQVLLDHGDRALSLANMAFEGTRIAAKEKQSWIFKSKCIHKVLQVKGRGF